MPDSGRPRSPLLRSLSSKDLRKKHGRKPSLLSVEDPVTYDIPDQTTQSEENLLQDLDNILHKKLHMSDTSLDSNSPTNSPKSGPNDGNIPDGSDDDSAGEDEDEEDFANVDEIDGPISPSSSSGSLKDLNNSTRLSPTANKFPRRAEEKYIPSNDADHNLPVDEEYQRQLDKRAAEIGNESFFHPVSKPKLHWSLKDFYSLCDEIPDWFNLTDYRHLKSSKDCFEKMFDSRKFLKDERYAMSTIETLDRVLAVSPLNMDSLLALAYISFGNFACNTNLKMHMEMIRRNCCLLINILPTIITMFKKHATFCRDKSSNMGQYTRLLFFSSSILYFIINTCIEHRETDTEQVQKVINSVSQEQVMQFLTRYIEHWRWNSRLSMRVRSMIIMLHRMILLQFGDRSHYEKTKKYIHRKHSIKNSSDNPQKLTVSPLDYQAFCEDVISRFPSYTPPDSQLPKGFDNPNSLSQFLEIPRPKARNAANLSLNVPQIHIATPAPSPCSSPVMQLSGAKMRKSFQTNMAYPLLYPSDDEDGLDDLTERADTLDNNKNDNLVPYNIQEATEILAGSVEVKLSTRQLWHERELFMIQERGWNSKAAQESGNDPYDYNHDNDDCEEIATMRRVEDYYHDCLPNLNSLVYVLLQIMESNLTNHEYFSYELPENASIDSFTPQLEITRTKEIALKSSSAILFLLLKWFKLSHCLKFEQLCVLLYDSKYINICASLLTKYSENYSERIFNRTISLPHSFWRECSNYNQEYQEFFSAAGKNQATAALNLRVLNSEVFMLQILSKVTGKKTQRLKELPLPIGSLFKKLYQLFNLDIYHPILKIIRELTPFKNKRWKSEHMELISGVYLYEKLPLTDNWVTGKDIAGELNDACGQEIALRALLQFYIFSHYKLTMGDFGYGEKTENLFFSKESEFLTTSCQM